MMQSLLLLGALFAIAATHVARPLTVRDWAEEYQKTTADRIRDHGYPAEVHQIETPDNYLVTMFRIPYSYRLQNAQRPRPAVLIQHGFSSCSDGWILNGPEDALAFLLADAGYDVWLGNARGNKYSRNNSRLSPGHPYFWRFSWHEIGVYDIAGMIDHIVATSGEQSLHYVGHSQGTTVFFVLMSSRPEYNARIKSAHLLAPVAFMSHISAPLAKYTRRIVGKPNRLSYLLDTMEVLPNSQFFVDMEALFCKDQPLLQFMCRNLIFLINGDTGVNMNMTIAEHMNETHPAGASSTQLIHYMQEYESGRFCQLDHGEHDNLKRYGQASPPDYDVTQISGNLHFYYSSADELSAVEDVEHLATLLPRKPNMFHVPDPTFTHSDFQWSMQVKEVINERIIGAIDAHELALSTLL